MKKIISLIALVAVTFGSVYAALPVKATHVATVDTTTKLKKTRSGVVKKKFKMKKDTTKHKM
jgi:hypothetical protein